MKKRVVNLLTLAFLLTLAINYSTSCSLFPDADASYKNMKIRKLVLMYMAADNDLYVNAGRNIEDLKKGYIPEFFIEGEGDVLLAYLDKKYESPKLLRFSKDEFDVVHTEVVMEYQEHNSASDSILRDILHYVTHTFPAEETGLILWDHGTGWMPEGSYSRYTANEIKPFSYGSDNGSEINIPELAAAMPEDVHFSYIIFDACFMSGVEVAYELRDKCDYILASPTEIMAYGFPYDRIMDPLFNTPAPFSLREIGKRYYEYYRDDIQMGASVALIDTDGLDKLADACADIYSTSRDKIDTLHMDEIQQYFRGSKRWFYDLEDFINRISSPEQYSAFADAMQDVVIYKAATEEFNIESTVYFEIERYGGLSTYIPNPGHEILDAYYKTLAWNKAVRMIE